MVFDGYMTPSTKDPEHQRRNSIPQSSFVLIMPENKATFSQERYLSLNDNKVAFINFLSVYFRDSGINVINCTSDADTEIASTALKLAQQNYGPILVVADDTDIAVLLLYHWKPTMNDIYLLQSRSNCIRSISLSQPDIREIKPHLLFVHAWSGCDTTSAIYGKGKCTIVKLLKSSPKLQHYSNVITNPSSTHDEVGEASIAAMKLLYGGSIGDSMCKIR